LAAFIKGSAKARHIFSFAVEVQKKIDGPNALKGQYDVTPEKAVNPSA
jgi:hypothetical protein